jgi:hypothetical protein
MARAQKIPMIRTALWGPLCLGAVLSLAAPVFAQEQDPAIATTDVADTVGIVADETLETAATDNGFTVKLKSLRATAGHIELRQSHSRDSVFYSIAPQMVVESASLRLDFVNSVSLVETRSQLRILNNGSVVGQFRLDPAHPNGVAQVEIPVGLIKQGYNQLSFEVAQHYTAECEDFTAPELWTQINTEKSVLVINGEFDLSNPTLSQLDDLISPNMGGARDFVIMAGAPDLSNDVLAWGGMLSQAVALRLNYINPNIRFERAAFAEPVVVADGEEAPVSAGNFASLDISHMDGENLILLGLVDDLRPYMSGAIANSITSSFVGIYPLDDHAGKFALVVSGTTNEEVHRAALSLGLDSFPFIDAATMLVSDIDIPLAAAQARDGAVNPNSIYRFADLALQTQTLSVVGEQSASLSFNLPADFYVKEADNFELSLDMSYGAGFRGDSVLNLYLNGNFAQAIGLSSVTGATFRDYKVYIPARSFIPGENEINFRPAFYSPYGGPCISPGRDNLLLTLSGSSELGVPDAERYVQQPDLSIFGRTGFPYTGDASGGDLSMLVAGRDDATITSALTLIGKLTQVADGALHRMQIGFDLPEEARSRNIIVVGAVDDIDKAVLENAPLTMSGEMSLPYPASSRLMGQVRQADFWADFNSAYEAARGRSEDSAPTPIVVQQTGGLGHNSLMAAYESPFAEGKTVSVFTAQTSEDLEANIEAIVAPDLWGQLAGDLALWNANHDNVWVQRAGPFFHVGKINFFEMMRYHLARSPWWWILGFFVIIPVFAWAIRSLVNTRRRLKESL